MQDTSRLDQLINAYLDGAMTADVKRELEAYLLSGAEARAHFWRCVFLHTSIRRVYESRQGSLAAVDAGTLSELAQLLALDDANVPLVELSEDEIARRAARAHQPSTPAKALPIHYGSNYQFDTTPVRHIVIPRWLVYGPIAAILLVTVLMALSIWDDSKRAHDPNVHVQQTALARLIWASDDARWDLSDQPPTPSTIVYDTPFHLTAGAIRMQFDNGAQVTLEAPAQMYPLDDNTVRLLHGKLAAECPRTARGFTVATQDGKIIDLGTQFGVIADHRYTDVHVFLGEVELTTKHTDGNTILRRVTTNRAARLTQGDIVAATPDLQSFATAFPHLALFERNLIVNGDFEADEPLPATDIEAPDIAISGWNDHGPATTVNYLQAAPFGYPDPAKDPMPDARGRAYFAGVNSSVIDQVIDISPAASLIDAEAVTYRLAGWFGGLMEHDDPMTITVTFIDEQGDTLSQTTLGPFDARTRNQRTGFFLRETSGRLPANTRQVHVEIRTELVHGGFADAYLDNLAFTLMLDGG